MGCSSQIECRMMTLGELTSSHNAIPRSNCLSVLLAQSSLLPRPEKEFCLAIDFRIIRRRISAPPRGRDSKAFFDALASMAIAFVNGGNHSITAGVSTTHLSRYHT